MATVTKELTLDASAWHESDDLYDNFFAAVGTPPWHGRNFDALVDSIATGDINATEVPYRIVVKNADRIEPGARKITTDFIALIQELADDGCPVQIQVTP